jgi:hypothetical protein
MACYLPVLKIKIKNCKNNPRDNFSTKEKLLNLGVKYVNSMFICCSSQPENLDANKLSDKEKIESLKKNILYSNDAIFQFIRTSIYNTFCSECANTYPCGSDQSSLIPVGNLNERKRQENLIDIISLKYITSDDLDPRKNPETRQALIEKCENCEDLDANPDLANRSSTFCNQDFPPEPQRPQQPPDQEDPDSPIPETPPDFDPDDIPSTDDGPFEPEDRPPPPDVGFSNPDDPPPDSDPRPEESADYKFEINYRNPCDALQKEKITVNVNIPAFEGGQGADDPETVDRDEMISQIKDYLSQNQDNLKRKIDIVLKEDFIAAQQAAINIAEKSYSQFDVDPGGLVSSAQPKNKNFIGKINIINNVSSPIFTKNTSANIDYKPVGEYINQFPFSFIVELPKTNIFVTNTHQGYEFVDKENDNIKQIFAYLFADELKVGLQMEIPVTIREVIEGGKLNIELSCQNDLLAGASEVDCETTEKVDPKYAGNVPALDTKKQFPYSNIEIFQEAEDETYSGVIDEYVISLPITINLSYKKKFDDIKGDKNTVNITKIPDYFGQGQDLNFDRPYTAFKPGSRKVALYQLEIPQAKGKTLLIDPRKNGLETHKKQLYNYIKEQFFSSINKIDPLFPKIDNKNKEGILKISETLQNQLEEIFESTIRLNGEGLGCCCCRWVLSTKDELGTETGKQMTDVIKGYACDENQFVNNQKQIFIKIIPSIMEE